MRVARAICDLCSADATHVDVQIAIDGSTPLTLDLCDPCHERLLRPVLDALDAHGVDPTREPVVRSWRRKPGRDVGPFLCLAGCNAAPLKHVDSFTQHLIRIHDGMTRDEYALRYGEPVPLTAAEQVELVIEVRCDVEGCEQSYSTERGNRWPQQAMISHMWGHHGVKWRPGSER